MIYPGIDFSAFTHKNKVESATPLIVWNHRWEHDKNPEEFFAAIAELKEMGYEFKLTILGQSFRNVPEVFTMAKEKFRYNIEHFGYVDSRSDYIDHLYKGDIVVSTAQHEFFGISMLEAVHAGCCPLAPDRLSYPELYPSLYLYQPGTLAKKLAEVLMDLEFYKKELENIQTQKYSWKSLLPQYEQWLLGS